MMLIGKNNMYKLKLKHHFDSAHRLKLDYKSKCENIHGHRWEVDIAIEGEADTDLSMIVDFTVIKEFFKQFDHVYLNEMDVLKGLNTTAENLATFWAEALLKLLRAKKEAGPVFSVRVDVAETPNNVATAIAKS